MEDVKPSVHNHQTFLGLSHSNDELKINIYGSATFHYQYKLWSMETECMAEISVSKLILMWLFTQTELP